jgi:hypothetical protein
MATPRFYNNNHRNGNGNGDRNGDGDGVLNSQDTDSL